MYYYWLEYYVWISMAKNILTAERINLDWLLSRCSHHVVSKARHFYNSGRVVIEEVDNDHAHVRVYQNDNTFYRVKVSFIDHDRLLWQCPCPRSDKRKFCEHHIAAAFKLHETLSQNKTDKWHHLLKQALNTPEPRKAPVQGLIVFSIQHLRDKWIIVPYRIAQKYIPNEIPSDFDELAKLFEETELVQQAQPIRSRVNTRNYPDVSKETLAATNLVVSIHNPSSSGGYYYGYHSPYHRNLAEDYGSILHLLSNSRVFTGTSSRPFEKPVQVVAEPGTLSIEIEHDAQGKGIWLLTVVTVNDQRTYLHAHTVEAICEDPLWLLVDSLLFHIPDVSDALLAMIEYPDVLIPTEEQEEFVEHYLLPMANTMPIYGESIGWEDVREEPVPRLYLGEAEGELYAVLKFGYGEYEVEYERKKSDITVSKLPGAMELARIYRQPEHEEDLYKGVTNHGLKRDKEPGWFVLRKNTSAVDFLLRHVPKLTEKGYEIYGEQNLTEARVNRNRPSISFNVSSGIDWFDIQAVVNFGDLEVSLKDIRRAIRRRDRYIKLVDGSIGALPEEWIERYRHLFAVGEETDTGVRVSHSHLTLLDQLMSEADRAQADEEFQNRLTQLQSFSSIASKKLPEHFQGELRPYQKAGYDWLQFLHDYNFGGCLADDMGTGKTIQALAMLQALYENGQATSATLIVMPRSLLFNWRHEAQRFTPKLRLFTHADQNRVQEPAEFDQYDLVFTTYGVMLRDIEMLRQYTFYYIILDESQAIKNPLAETSKAARLLQGKHRLVLTGTPVENSTMELWSQFSFINPGLLGNLDYFRKEFVSPIERNQDTDTAQFLRKMVYPFILRRTKDQVAPDLPPRIERILETDMEDEQRAFYDRQRDYYRGLLLGMIEEEGMDQARMKILEGLLRLRQICNHPRLVDSSFKGGSAKFDLLLETMETLRSEGHKALIFSQFVQMLTIVRENLDRYHIPYAYLDGQTRDREGVVHRFQTNESIPFFLISLKAGGVGLNLTAADYVIHIDPWWNPAVEMQATDRTHRIGQDKPVFVYKLVARDSVEEKILLLQDRKRELVEQIIDTESSGLFKSLTQDDIEVLFT
jgi:non-specific serine/threonine protein kinase